MDEMHIQFARAFSTPDLGPPDDPLLKSKLMLTSVPMHLQLVQSDFVSGTSQGSVFITCVYLDGLSVLCNRDFGHDLPELHVFARFTQCVFFALSHVLLRIQHRLV